MAKISHIFDPKGDTILVLRHPNPPFAVWHKDEEWTTLPTRRSPLLTDTKLEFQAVDPAIPKDTRSAPPAEYEPEPTSPETQPSDSEPEPAVVPVPWEALEEAPVDAPPPADDVPEDTGPEEIRMQVSSRHLALTSSYFGRMFEGPWEEGSTRLVEAEDWDEGALVILMTIIHGRNRTIPRSINIEMLAKIAVLVDYYECHEVVELFAEIWISKLKKSIPEQYGRDLVLWLFVSRVFSRTDLIERMTGIVMREGRGPLHTLNLPIPVGLVEQLEKRRQESIQSVLSILHKLITYFRDERTACSFECSSILFGALTKQMQVGGLLPRPQAPLLGYNFTALNSFARSIQSPVWGPKNNSSYYQQHSCKLPDFLGEKMNRLERRLDARNSRFSRRWGRSMVNLKVEDPPGLQKLSLS